MQEDNDIKVSVWCTCYNHEKYIRKCLDGFVMQKTDFKFEVIVHDDASTDDSPYIIMEYADKYPDIIKPIYEDENQYSKKVNLEKEYFLPNIKGEYVAFCEGDDYWCDKNKLQAQVNMMERFQTKACFHNTQVVDENSSPIAGLTYPSIEKNQLLSIMGGVIDSRFMMFFINDMKCYLHISSFMFEADEFKKYENDLPEFAVELKKIGIGDAPLISYFASLDKTAYFPASLSCYRNSHEGSYTFETSKKLKEDPELRKSVSYAWAFFYFKFNEFSGNRYRDIIIDRNVLFKKTPSN